MNPDHLEIIQHSLGCDQYGQSKAYRDENDGTFGYYRNRYVCGPMPDLQALVALGLMKDHGPQAIAASMHCYSVTREGVAAMKQHSPKPPVLTRNQKRYREFLDSDCGWTFGEFLKWRSANKDRLASLGYAP